ncbi:type II secretion system protein [Prosthecobacter sp.]|uniref:type II secretion system protein n=1 Tax=Prosthecobacter sp. TaxID=1965333 RepID=UPI002488087A|nr:type II secretion system protein [Prosthecobacter sp.]MDI1311137.1 type II secretion system protein [Prosthecobacter sp.]
MKKLTYTSKQRRSASAFSLFEVLMFIAIIGVMVGMAMPMLGQSDAVYAARDRRNAQELCSTCMMAQAAELNFVQDESVIDTVRAIVRGGMSVRGAMRGRVFVVPGLSDEDIQGAAKFLRVQDGQLMYTTASTSPAGDQRL